MAGTSGVMFVVSYRCPHCGAVLEGRLARADAWLRCPGCGRASRPPDHAVTQEDQAPRVAPGEDVLVIGPAPEPAPMTPVAVAMPDRRRQAEPADPRRVVYAAALFVVVVLLVFAFLEQSLLGTAVFSVGAAVFLAMLARPDRSRSGG